MDNKMVVTLAAVFLVVVGAGLIAASAISGGHGNVNTYDSGSDKSTITVKHGDVFNVTLAENPSTGYAWNVSATSGLTVVDCDVVASQSGLVGSPGVHVWQVTASGAGDQQFSGIYKRPWEPAFGNETTYTLNVKIV